VKSETTVLCRICQLPLISGEGLGFVRFKIPGCEAYQFFHNRFRHGDCWEIYLKKGKPV
jgi:hypothetical protein